MPTKKIVAKVKITPIRKKIFETFTDEQKEIAIHIIGKAVLVEKGRHYVRKEEIELKKTLNADQKKALDEMIKDAVKMDVF